MFNVHISVYLCKQLLRKERRKKLLCLQEIMTDHQPTNNQQTDMKVPRKVPLPLRHKELEKEISYESS